ncbi:hypothetical protein [Chondromyces apiculatus]|uniref:Uncharacterized protein n=1 Tax=Chondromyces apiculatus DSM 436 TaxID=1192034 RepID=A0A017SYV1_9BACT|nr:hypothetical protein [Chondromyces apiculatus]EYF01476.1 Hypothetical protein CAP_8309 [Chondromyces apiculatus DSM 436]
MKRRHLLGAAAAGLAMSAWPSFIQEAFGGKGDASSGGTAAKTRSKASVAVQRAKQARRPLLVFVIPADDSQKYDRGRAFGELLNHGTDKDLAPLSDVEVVCATMSDLKKVVPGAGEGDPLMVLVRTDGASLAATQLDAALPDDPSMGSMPWDELEKATERTIQSRIDALGMLLRKELGADSRKLEARAASVRARMVRQPPSGARWARASGCGTTIEGEENRGPRVACGMGHVPEKSGRFLYFFTNEWT